MKAITIIGKRWFDKTYGNTYCSARVFIDGNLVLKIPWTYGYGNFYEQLSIEKIIKQKLVKLKND